MRVRYSLAAEAELADAIDWYASREDGERLVDRFLSEVVRVESLAKERPRAWPEVEPGVRRVVLDRFPFSLIYRITADELQVLAVAHHRRRPGCWRDRLE
ncbi:MAG: type II toxin-antitoxin system RelE/ParE family toxin [Enhygromyxa sp.]